MGILSLDTEFMEYWLKLSSMEKAYLLSIAKQFVQLKEEMNHISIEQYNREIDEAMSRMNNGELVTHEQVLQISRNLLLAQKGN